MKANVNKKQYCDRKYQLIGPLNILIWGTFYSSSFTTHCNTIMLVSSKCGKCTLLVVFSSLFFKLSPDFLQTGSSLITVIWHMVQYVCVDSDFLGISSSSFPVQFLHSENLSSASKHFLSIHLKLKRKGKWKLYSLWPKKWISEKGTGKENFMITVCSTRNVTPYYKWWMKKSFKCDRSPYHEKNM